MKRGMSFPNRLMLLFAFAMTFMLGFLTFKNMSESAAVNAAYNGFSAGNIISDYVMGDYGSMSEAEIQNFLKSKNACNDTNTAKASYYSNHTYHIVNGHFVCMADESFNGESAAHIIWQAAQDYRINPKVIIVLLEKEQGLVTDTWPNFDLQYRSATGYGCPDTAACDSTYYGFKNQIRNAAELYRYILDNGSRYYPVGNNFVKYNPDAGCGGSTVYIQNRATAALYQYTPYQPNASVLNTTPGTVVSCGAYGNANFYYYFTRWFGDTHTTVTTVNFPADTFTLKVSSGKYLVPASNAVGAKLIISSSASEAQRQYKLTKSGDFYVITHVASGLVLDLPSASTTDGNYIQLYSSNGTNAQKWRFSVSGDGYTLHSACADGKVIDVPGGAVNAEGQTVQIWSNNGSNAQKYIVTDLAAAPVANGTYVLESTGAKAIDIDGGRTANGTRIHLYNLTYSNNQQFALTRSADGLYTIKNVASGRVLDVVAGGINNGTALQLYDSNNSCAQKWVVEKSGAGYRFLSACSGRAIDVPGGATGTILKKLQIYAANNSAAQVWILRNLNPLADGNYTITSGLGKNLVVDIAGGAENSKNGTNVNIYTANNTNAQKWQVTYNASVKAYSIINTYAKKSLDVAAGLTSAGVNVQAWSSNSTCAQFWRLHPSSNGSYNIISACSDKVLDVSGGAARNGGNIQIYNYNGTNAQKWTFNKI